MSFKNYHISRKDRATGRGGGVVILSKSNIKTSLYTNSIYDCNGKIECCVLNVFDSIGKLTIVSVYRPPNSGRIDSSEWKDLFA